MDTLKKHKQLLPVVILLIYCLYTLISISRRPEFIDGPMLTTRHYIAFAAVALNFLVYFIARRYFYYVLIPTFIAGLCSLIVFTPASVKVGFSVKGTAGGSSGSLGLDFQPAAFWAFLSCYIINFKYVNQRIMNMFRSSPEEVHERELQLETDAINKFRERYAEYSSEKLADIIAANKYVPEALEAARQLLAERQQQP